MESPYEGDCGQEETPQAHIDIELEMAVIPGDERYAAGPALGPRRPAEGTLGDEADRIRLELVDDARYPAACEQRKAYLGIDGERSREEFRRLDNPDDIPACFEARDERMEHAYHAVRLGRPGIGHQEQLFHTEVSSISVSSLRSLPRMYQLKM